MIRELYTVVDGLSYVHNAQIWAHRSGSDSAQKLCITDFKSIHWDGYIKMSRKPPAGDWVQMPDNSWAVPDDFCLFVVPEYEARQIPVSDPPIDLIRALSVYILMPGNAISYQTERRRQELMEIYLNSTYEIPG